jgi:hypothetical protein
MSVRSTLNCENLRQMSVSRFALIAGEAPALPVIKGPVQIGSTFCAKPQRVDPVATAPGSDLGSDRTIV